MKIPQKKLMSGFSMPALGFGTWLIGGNNSRNPQNDDVAQIKAIKRAIDAGITHIDTAEMYAEGFAEKIVARAISDYDRESLFIVSKVWSDNLRYDDLINAAKKSLERLNTSYLDLYLIHMPNPEIPLEESVKAMDKLKQDGLIKNIGLSNFKKESFKKAQNYSRNKIVADQVHYNLIYREPEADSLLKYCQENDVMLCAWRPIEKGLLTRQGIPVADNICSKYTKTPAQISINWLLSQKNVVTLAKMVNSGHLRENLGAINFSMEENDVEMLRENFPGQKKVSAAVPLG